MSKAAASLLLMPQARIEEAVRRLQNGATDFSQLAANRDALLACIRQNVKELEQLLSAIESERPDNEAWRLIAPTLRSCLSVWKATAETIHAAAIAISVPSVVRGIDNPGDPRHPH